MVTLQSIEHPVLPTDAKTLINTQTHTRAKEVTNTAVGPLNLCAVNYTFRAGDITL